MSRIQRWCTQYSKHEQLNSICCVEPILFNALVPHTLLSGRSHPSTASCRRSKLSQVLSRGLFSVVDGRSFWFVYRMVKLISSIGESFYNFRPGHPGRSWRTRSWKSWALNVYHCSQWKMHCNCILVEALNQIIRHNQTQDSFEVKARSRWWRSHSPHHSEAKDKSPKAQI